MGGELCRFSVEELTSDGKLFIGDGYRAKNAELSASGLPFARAGNINNGFHFQDSDRFPVEQLHRVGNRVSRPGDVVFTSKGTVGRFALVKANTETFVYSPQLCFWRSRDHGLIEPRFLYYWMYGREFYLQYKGVAGQTDMAEYVSLTDQRRMHISLPEIGVQRAVARILGALDDKIELNRKMNATLEAMARALFKSWFVDFDPVRAKADGRAPSAMDAETARLFPSEFADSELGPIPKGWRATTLGTEVERCGGAVQTGPFGSQLHASDYVPEGVPVVMPKDIGGRRVSTASIARVREVDAVRLSRHRLQPGDVVYSRRGDVERHALIGARETGWLCGTGCLLVRLGRSWPSPMFASFALDRPETRAWISQHAIGATMPNLNTGILSAVPLVMPTDDVLRAFARSVDPLQSLVVARDAEAHLLSSSRDRLLPPLLSGELSVAQAERDAGAVS
jgi:type I restriction enzyme S subunit